MTTKKGVCLALLGVAVSLTMSCQSTAIQGRDGMTYYLQPRMDSNGYYHRVMITQDIATGTRAAAAGLRDLKIKVGEFRNDKIIGLVNGEMADGKKVRITIQKNMSATEMRIYLGDRARATQIFQAISKNLR